MEFIKNLIKIILIAVVVFAALVSCVPSEWVALNVWPYTIPMFFIIGAYCYTYKTNPMELIEKVMKN